MGRSKEEVERKYRKENPEKFLSEFGQAPPEVELSTPCGKMYSESAIPGICYHCGRGVDLHKEIVPMLTYKEAIWKWLLKYGGVTSYYGGYDSRATANIRFHMQDCDIDTDLCRGPFMDASISQFSGTMDDTDAHASERVVSAYITCCCEQITNEHWCVREEMTLGELIYQVIQEGLHE